MPFSVFLTDDAADDLSEIYGYIDIHDVPGKADYVIGRIEGAFDSLSENPERGAFPKELLSVGIREFREIYFKPYRIVYRVNPPNVFVLLIADGRRNMEVLLQRRLLKPWENS